MGVFESIMMIGYSINQITHALMLIEEDTLKHRNDEVFFFYLGSPS